jgi:hypothetical protein
MNQKDASLKSMTQPNTGLGVVCKSSFLMLLVLLLLASTTSIASKYNSLRDRSNLSSLPVSENIFGKQAAQIPILFAVIDPTEFESLREDGIDDDCQDNSSDDLLCQSLIGSLAVADEKIFLYSVDATLNRPQVPFFILYHSWKTYLS